MKRLRKAGTALVLAVTCFLCSSVNTLAATTSTAGTVTYVSNLKSTTESVLATSANAKEIYHFLVYNMGLNSAAACGVLANIRRESYFNPNALGDGGTSYGICQWHDTSEGVGRYTNLKNWCAANGFDYTTLNGQLNFLKFELSQNNRNILYNGKTIYDNLLMIENTSVGAYNAGFYWCNTFEVPYSNNPEKRAAECDSRGILARDVYWSELAEPSLGDVYTVPGGISVNWAMYEGAFQYELYRYANGDLSTIVQVATTLETSFIDSTVVSGNTYTYLLCADCLQPDGTVSVINAKETSIYYLASTTLLSITGSPSAQKITWSAVPGATSYLIFRNENNGEYVQIATTDTTSYKDTTATTNDIKYHYKVYAYYQDALGNTICSLPSNILGSYALEQPVIYSIKTISTGINIKWNKVAHAKYYIIYRSVNNGAYEEIASITGKSFTDEEAEGGAKNKYKVVACFATDKNEFSKSVRSEPVYTYYIKTPTLKSLSTKATRTLAPSWSRDTYATGYEIQYAGNKSFTSGKKTLTIVTNDTTSWKITGMVKGKTYYARVRSYKTVKGVKYYSAWSNIKSLKVK